MLKTLDRVKPENRPFAAYGNMVEILMYKGDEMLVEGPAGTGKTRTICEKVHLCMEKYAGARALLVRQTRESMNESVLVTYEQQVVPEGHPALDGPQRRYRHSYLYPNGSEIVLGGMDNPKKILSTEYDLIVFFEAIEGEKDAFETLTTRNRNFVMPYQQVIADTNPGHPKHWLNLRPTEGNMKRIQTTFQDNPKFWSHEHRTWTDEGLSYVEGKLAKLSGVRKARYYSGLWVAAEGMIYDNWNSNVHMCDRFEVPRNWDIFWTIDFGYVHPFVWQLWAKEPGPNGVMVRCAEIYRRYTLVEDMVPWMLEIGAGYKNPSAIVCDHDAEDRATLERHLRKRGLTMRTTPANKAVLAGIQAVKERLEWESRPDRKPRLQFMRDSNHYVDKDLKESHKPWRTEDEFDGYAWKDPDKPKPEQPVKEDDHGLDDVRYAVSHCDVKAKRKMGVS